MRFTSEIRTIICQEAMFWNGKLKITFHYWINELNKLFGYDCTEVLYSFADMYRRASPIYYWKAAPLSILKVNSLAHFILIIIHEVIKLQTRNIYHLKGEICSFKMGYIRVSNLSILISIKPPNFTDNIDIPF